MLQQLAIIIQYKTVLSQQSLAVFGVVALKSASLSDVVHIQEVPGNKFGLLVPTVQRALRSVAVR